MKANINLPEEVNPHFFEQDELFIFDRMNTVYKALQRHCLVLDVRDFIDWHIVFQRRNKWDVFELN